MRNSQYPFLMVSYLFANSIRHDLARAGFVSAYISAKTSNACTLTVGTSDTLESSELIGVGFNFSSAVCFKSCSSSTLGTNSSANDSIEDKGRLPIFNTLWSSEKNGYRLYTL